MRCRRRSPPRAPAWLLRAALLRARAPRRGARRCACRPITRGGVVAGICAPALARLSIALAAHSGKFSFHKSWKEIEVVFFESGRTCTWPSGSGERAGGGGERNRRLRGPDRLHSEQQTSSFHMCSNIISLLNGRRTHCVLSLPALMRCLEMFASVHRTHTRKRPGAPQSLPCASRTQNADVPDPIPRPPRPRPPSTCSPTHRVRVFGRGASVEALHKPTPPTPGPPARARTIHGVGRRAMQCTTRAHTHTPLHFATTPTGSTGFSSSMRRRAVDSCA